MQVFKNKLHNEFGTWPFAYTASGGADVGEIVSVAAAVGDGDDTAYHEAWIAAGDRMAAEGDAALGRGLRTSAGELYLRAASCYATSYHPLYGEPVDPRLVAAFRKQIAAFDKGLALRPVPVVPRRVAFEGAAMPAYFVPAEGREGERRPLVILTNGYDASVTEMYFMSAPAISRRGYHVLMFDGPGQGGMLIEQGVRLRPDWDTVVRAVVDHALTIDTVDPDRIALSGASLGGYLAPRAAAGEPRIAACIADPGSPGIAHAIAALAMKSGASEEAARDITALPDSVLARMQGFFDTDPKWHWAIAKRGFWVHGVSDLRGFIRAVAPFDLDPYVDQIRCPTLITAAENDTLSVGAGAVFEKLRCPKTLIRFTAAEGAGEHCEMQNRSLLNRRVAGWLDEIFGQATGSSVARPEGGEPAPRLS